MDPPKGWPFLATDLTGLPLRSEMRQFGDPLWLTHAVERGLGSCECARGAMPPT